MLKCVYFIINITSSYSLYLQLIKNQTITFIFFRNEGNCSLTFIMNQKSKIAIALLCFFLFLNGLNAQISGIIKDSTAQKGIGFATVALFSEKDTTPNSPPVQAVFSEDNGKFRLEKVAAGTYRLEIVMMGFAAKKISNILISGEEERKDLGTILLQTADLQMKSVEITAQKPLVEMKEDRLVYNVENDMMAQSGTTLEVMKKVPYLSVDQDDKIRVKGKENFKVLLNGKATGVVSRNPSEALKSFPATAIKRIEVITNPSAKYDAEGASAVINIITKKAISGYNGGVSGSINTFLQGNANGYLNGKKDKLGVSSYVGVHRWSRPASTSNSYMESLVDSLAYTQTYNGTSISSSLGGYGNLEIAYDIDSLKSLSLYSNLNNWNSGNSSESHFLQTSETGAIQRKSDFLSDSKNNDFSVEVGTDYLQKFGNTNSDHQFSFSFLQNWGNGQNYSNNDNYNPNRFYQNDNQTRTKETTINTDYTLPFAKIHKFSVGIKAILRTNNSDYQNFIKDTLTNIYNENPLLTNIFTYNQNVYSTYAEYVLTKGKWTVKPGARLEYTTIQGDFRSANQKIENKYTNLIPTFTTVYKITEMQTLNFSYSKRLQRPGLWYLNPFVDNANPLAISYGNPYLKPELTHSLELSYGRFGGFGNLNISLSQNFMTQNIGNFTTLNAESGVSTTSYQNLGKGSSTSLGIYLSGHAGKNFNYFANSEVAYNILQSNLNGKAYKNSGFNGHGYGNMSYSFPKNFKLQAEGHLWMGEVTIQGKNGRWYGYGLGFGKSFFDKKLSISIGAQNFLSKYVVSKSTSQDPSFKGGSVFYSPSRAIRFSINYRFGTLQEQVSRKKGVSNNDVKSGGGGGGK